MAGCARATSPTADATQPTAPPILSDDAAPREVLEVFLKTLVIGDCAATRELTTEDGFAQIGGFCQRIHVVNFAVVGDGTVVDADSMTFATTLTIDGVSHEFVQGDHTIYFGLDRQAGGAWRITGGGTAP